MSDRTCGMGGCSEPVDEGSGYCVRHRAPAGVRPRAVAVGSVQDARLVCPHCGVTGRVSSRRVKVKRGISGGKATGAVLTAGLSVLATGLSRKERATERHCGNCGTDWLV